MTTPAPPSRFTITPLSIPGVCAVRRHRMGDARGSLTRVFCPDELAAAGWQLPVAQVNHSHTLQAGTVRGMHYQRPPCAEAKLVTCLRGLRGEMAPDFYYLGTDS